MIYFFVSLILFGHAPVNDNVEIWAGKRPETKKSDPCVAIEYHTVF